MRRSTISCAAALCLCSLLLQTAESESASLRSIRQLYRNKEYEEAKSVLKRELPGFRGKSYSEGLLLLASLETQVEEAVPIYREVIAAGRTKESLMARIELAKIYYAASEYYRAINILTELPSRGNTDDRLEAIYFRALCWRQMGNVGRARNDLMNIDRGKYLYWSYMALAELDMQEGEIEDAVERYETIAGGHSNPIAGFKLAECYEILGEKNKAIETYQTLVHQFPKSLEAPKAREKINMLRFARTTRRSHTDREGGEEGEASEDGQTAEQAGFPRFTVQFGAFTERENAIRLAEELTNVTGEVWVERVARNGQIWHRVRVGRFSTREEANKKATQIREETGYYGRVLPLD